MVVNNTVTATCNEKTPALEVVQLEKAFGRKGSITKALNGVSLTVAAGEFVAIMGPSGSGKSTLLNCVATIEKPTAGVINVGGKDITKLRGGALSKFRGSDLGFIFQDANLLDTLTGFENIALALTITGAGRAVAEKRVRAIAAQLGVEDVLDKLPSQMSGGQRQRIAAARAVVANPALVLADEPTGALDSRNSTVMLNTLENLNKNMGATIMMVTHDAYAASFAHRVLFIKDGRLFTELRAGAGDAASSRKGLFNRVMQTQALLGGDAVGAAGDARGVAHADARQEVRDDA